MGRFHRPFGNFIGHNLENQGCTPLKISIRTKCVVEICKWVAL